MQKYIFDGAMGTMLQQAGLEAGMCPEILNIQAPEQVTKVHIAYLEAGADIITTNTFGGSRAKLKEYGLENQVEEINKGAVAIARMACRQLGKGKVAATLGPTGYFVEPLGDVSFEEMYEIFREQANALASEGPDYLLLETFSDLGELRAALLACKDVCEIPVICSLTYMGKRTLTGVSPTSAAIVAESLGAYAIGCNCSGGPEELLPIIAELASVTTLPLIVEPNAGLPLVADGEVKYPLEPEAFQQAMELFLPYQVQFLGGCCGTTPKHIELLKETLADYVPQSREVKPYSYVASRERAVVIGEDVVPKLIGERINPTARKKMAEGLRQGEYGVIQNEAEIQIQAGAHLLDVNVGTHGINQKQVMGDLIGLLQQGESIPLVIDSTDPDVIHRALEVYHGKALINSVNGEKASMDAILPLAKRYGAGIIALTLDEDGIPEKAEERLKVAQRIVQRCDQLGISRKDIYVDALALTVGTDIQSPRETLKTIALVKETLGVNTVLGVSNISYGLPNRPKINSAFLAMAIAQGLDLAIINPLDERMMDTWQGASLLAGRDYNGEHYLSLNAGTDSKGTVVQEEQETSVELVTNLVVKGSANVEKIIIQLIEKGVNPLDIINQGLIPGLIEVGNKYEEGTYFLPQLMLSAETAQKAFKQLEGYMPQDAGLNKGTIVIGTVKGDIHDIGKNMVAVMLKNHGYQVIDLGKNVPSEEFVKAVEDNQAHFLGLSALMTTTMQEIPKVIELVKANNPNIHVFIGGAVITSEFAEEVGAGYGKDAVSTVRMLDGIIERK